MQLRLVLRAQLQELGPVQELVQRLALVRELEQLGRLRHHSLQQPLQASMQHHASTASRHHSSTAGRLNH